MNTTEQTIPLEEMLAAINPLPWSERDKPFETFTRGSSEEVRNISHEEEEANRAYILHSTKVLPGLVDALRGAMEVLEDTLETVREQHPYGPKVENHEGAIGLCKQALESAGRVRV